MNPSEYGAAVLLNFRKLLFQNLAGDYFNDPHGRHPRKSAGTTYLKTLSSFHEIVQVDGAHNSSARRPFVLAKMEIDDVVAGALVVLQAASSVDERDGDKEARQRLQQLAL